MTIESPPLYIQADTYPARLDRFPLALMYDEGVQKHTHCQVSQRGAGANFTVDIAVGTFIIQGDDQTNQGSYIGRITATENVAIGAAPGSNSRYDLVTLRVNDPNAGGNTGSNVTAVVVAGTASATPTVPALPGSSIAIAVVGPIAAGTASITNSLIHDSMSGGMPASAPVQVRFMAGRVDTPGTIAMAAGTVNRSGWLYCDGTAQLRATYPDLFAEIGINYGAGDGSTTFNIPDFRGKMPVGFSSGGTFPTVGATGGEVTHTLTGLESGVQDHNHGGATLGESASHTHTYSGATGVENAAHQHNVMSSSGTYQPYVGFTGSAQNDGVNTLIMDGYPSGNAQRLITDTENANHVHGFSGTTSTETAAHAHVINGSGNINAASAHNNMPPYQVITGYLIRT